MEYYTGTTDYKYWSIKTTVPSPGTYTFSYYARLVGGADGNFGNSQIWRNDGVGDATPTGDWNPIMTRSWRRFSAYGTVNTSLNFFCVHSGAVTGGYTIQYCGFQLESGSYATPFVVGTRSNTQSIVDLAGGNTVTANSLTYASTNSFSFNGTANYITASTKFPTITNEWTVETWVKPAASQPTNNNDIWGNHGAYDGFCLQNIGTGTQYAAFYGNGTAWQGWPSLTFNLTVSVWQCITVTRTTTNTLVIYLNGVQVNSMSVTGNMATGAVDFMIGQGYSGATRTWSGEIATTSVYGRGLTSNEVVQNFNALRGRFGA
jgi:hypothetical protein